MGIRDFAAIGGSMAQDFDQFPVDDLLSDRQGYMTPQWASFMNTFYQNIIGYLTQFGMFPPHLETYQRDQIHNPQIGQMIYNTTVDAPQIYQYNNGNPAWKTFTTS